MDQQVKNKKTLKGISNGKDIKHEDYLSTFQTNELLKKEVISLRSIDRRLSALKQSTIALTSMYDKKHLVDSTRCVPFGYQVEASRPLEEIEDAVEEIEDELLD